MSQESREEFAQTFRKSSCKRGVFFFFGISGFWWVLGDTFVHIVYGMLVALSFGVPSLRPAETILVRTAAVIGLASGLASLHLRKKQAWIGGSARGSSREPKKKARSLADRSSWRIANFMRNSLRSLAAPID